MHVIGKKIELRLAWLIQEDVDSINNNLYLIDDKKIIDTVTGKVFNWVYSIDIGFTYLIVGVGDNYSCLYGITSNSLVYIDTIYNNCKYSNTNIVKKLFWEKPKLNYEKIANSLILIIDKWNYIENKVKEMKETLEMSGSIDEAYIKPKGVCEMYAGYIDIGDILYCKDGIIASTGKYIALTPNKKVFDIQEIKESTNNQLECVLRQN